MIHKRYDIKIAGRGDVAGFLNKLAISGTKVQSLYVIGDDIYFRTDRKGVREIRRHRRSYQLKAWIAPVGHTEGANRIFFSYRFLIACVIPFACSFFVWTVTVESDQPEVVERIENKLQATSIVPLRPLASIPDEGEIRRHLMQDDPLLSWVRFRKVGTSLTIIPMLSPPSTRSVESDNTPSDLVARTGGVISRFELKRGERVGRVHQTVKKGDILATGILEQGDKTTIVGAEGAVYADYWVEYKFSLPRMIAYRFQGEEIVEFIFDPPWKKAEKPTEGSVSEGFLRSIFRTNRHVEEVTGKLELEEGMEETIIVPLLKNKILSEPSSKAIIKEDKILHVTFDNDKVSGTILFLINDDIAIKRPISQGD